MERKVKKLTHDVYTNTCVHKYSLKKIYVILLRSRDSHRDSAYCNCLGSFKKYCYLDANSRDSHLIVLGCGLGIGILKSSPTNYIWYSTKVENYCLRELTSLFTITHQNLNFENRPKCIKWTRSRILILLDCHLHWFFSLQLPLPLSIITSQHSWAISELKIILIYSERQQRKPFSVSYIYIFSLCGFIYSKVSSYI